MLPTVLTVTNLLCGVGAILTCSSPGAVTGLQDAAAVFGTAAWLILVAMLFDALDGRVARATGAASEFGGELDSLADVITFGVAPAVLAHSFLYKFVEPPFNNRLLLFFLVAIFPMCAALRLARFNVENTPGEDDHRFFKGLPSPAAAGTVASIVLLHLWLSKSIDAYGTHANWIPSYALPVLVVALSLLMVSTWRYSHLSNKVFGQQRSFFFVIVFIFFCIVTVVFTEVVLAVLFLTYAVSGVVGFAADRLIDLIEMHAGDQT